MRPALLVVVLALSFAVGLAVGIAGPAIAQHTAGSVLGAVATPAPAGVESAPRPSPGSGGGWLESAPRALESAAPTLGSPGPGGSSTTTGLSPSASVSPAAASAAPLGLPGVGTPPVATPSSAPVVAPSAAPTPTITPAASLAPTSSQGPAAPDATQGPTAIGGGPTSTSEPERIAPITPDARAQLVAPDIQAAEQVAAPESLSGYIWPLPAGRLTLPFGASNWGSHLADGRRFHDGIDLATFCGDRIRAAHDGVVLAAGRRFDAMIGWVGDLGPYTRRLTAKNLWQTLPITIVVDDGNGYRSIYAHFAKIVVRAGQAIRAGQFLGYEGQTGHASGCHLHFGIFSPAETMLMSVRPEVIARMKLPRYALMRIDPLRVLPHRRGRDDPRPRTYLATRETAAAARKGIDPHPIAAPTPAPSPAVSPPSSEEPSGPPTRPRS